MHIELSVCAFICTLGGCFLFCTRLACKSATWRRCGNDLVVSFFLVIFFLASAGCCTFFPLRVCFLSWLAARRWHFLCRWQLAVRAFARNRPTSRRLLRRVVAESSPRNGGHRSLARSHGDAHRRPLWCVAYLWVCKWPVVTRRARARARSQLLSLTRRLVQPTPAF